MDDGSETMHDSGSTVRSWLISGSYAGFDRDIVISAESAELNRYYEPDKQKVYIFVFIRHGFLLENILNALYAIKRHEHVSQIISITRKTGVIMIKKIDLEAMYPEGVYTASGPIKKRVYEKELARLQIELVKLQAWIKHKKLKIVVIFEGRDAAGKGGTIKRITEPLNPRTCRVAALPAPTDRQKTQWYFQRYAAHLPAAGEMLIMDRSWYSPMNNFPVDVMRQFCGRGTVIGVNVSPSEEMTYTFQDKAGISGWQILWSRVNPFAKPIETPSLIANIMRAMEINSVHQINNRQRLADVLIQPDVGQFGMLDFGSYQQISEAGYLAAREELVRWLEN